MASGSGIGVGRDWRSATSKALEQVPPGPCELALVFASPQYRERFGDMLAMIRERIGPAILAGCSGLGVIGRGTEMEGVPAVSILGLSLPGADLRAWAISPEELAQPAAGWYTRFGLTPDEVRGWLVFADPFTAAIENLLEALTEGFPGVPVLGGLATGTPVSRSTQLFLDGHVLGGGAVVVAVGGGWALRPVVSQGAQPIGQTWTITDAQQNVLRSLGGRPPLDVLRETIAGLPDDQQHRATRNLLVGLAMDEYRDEFQLGDFLIRNLVGIDQESGSIAIGDRLRVGQTAQFQLRDAEAAKGELRSMLARARAELGGVQPAGALLCSCNGRGVGLFGEPHQDAIALQESFGGIPVAGFFCNGEIGPVGGKTFLHGFTASIAFFVPA